MGFSTTGLFRAVLGAKAGAYRNFQYIINNVMYCNNFDFFNISFIVAEKKSLKGLRTRKKS